MVDTMSVISSIYNNQTSAETKLRQAHLEPAWASLYFLLHVVVLASKDLIIC